MFFPQLGSLYLSVLWYLDTNIALNYIDNQGGNQTFNVNYSYFMQPALRTLFHNWKMKGTRRESRQTCSSSLEVWPANFGSDSESVRASPLQKKKPRCSRAHQACRVMSRNILPISAPRKKKFKGRARSEGRCDTSPPSNHSEADKHHAPIPG